MPEFFPVVASHLIIDWFSWDGRCVFERMLHKLKLSLVFCADFHTFLPTIHADWSFRSEHERCAGMTGLVWPQQRKCPFAESPTTSAHPSCSWPFDIVGAGWLSNVWAKFLFGFWVHILPKHCFCFPIIESFSWRRFSVGVNLISVLG